MTPFTSSPAQKLGPSPLRMIAHMPGGIKQRLNHQKINAVVLLRPIEANGGDAGVIHVQPNPASERF